MKKYSYIDIKNIIKEKSNGECELISLTYENSHTPLLLKCKCGNEFKRTWNKLRNSQYICMQCIHKNYAKNYSSKIEKVIEFIESKNCKYIDGVYENVYSKLKLQCSCGEIFVKDFNHFRRGQNRCPKCGNESLKTSKKKYDLEFCRKKFADKGYTLLENQYINCTQPMKCICKRGHEVELKLMLFLRGQSGCHQCQVIEQSGEGHWNYKGGESEVLDALRKSIKEWKLQILKRDNYRCVITDRHDQLEVHHLKSFMTIVKETCDELNLPLLRKIKDYKESEFEQILNLFLSKHTLDVGVTLNIKVHEKFHSIYGKNDNTLEQFKEFKMVFNN